RQMAFCVYSPELGGNSVCDLPLPHALSCSDKAWGIQCMGRLSDEQAVDGRKMLIGVSAVAAGCPHAGRDQFFAFPVSKRFGRNAVAFRKKTDAVYISF